MKQQKHSGLRRFLCIFGLTTGLLLTISHLEGRGSAHFSGGIEKREELASVRDRPLLFATSDDAGLVVRGNTEFAIDLYQQFKEEDGNLFFSPLSVSFALAMIYGGAKNNTAREIAEVLHFDLPAEQLHGGFEEIVQRLEINGGELKMGNRVWLQQDFPVLESFLALTRDRYKAPVAQIDFSGDTEAARQTINDWVAQRTQNNIQDAIPPQTITSLTRFVLTNVIFFQDSWFNQFPKENTREAPFRISSEREVLVPMMYDDIRYLSYVEYPDLQILELPYQSGAFSMVILLPREVEGSAQLEQNLTADNLIGWLQDLDNVVNDDIIDVFLPKFSITSEFQMNETLQQMGMTQAFSDRADFTGIFDSSPLVLQAVVHKAFVEVDEEGTKAGAATLGGGGSLSAPQLIAEFKADRPFIFLIRDFESNSILFIGRVTNPLE